LEISPRPLGGVTSRSIRVCHHSKAVRLFEGNLSARRVDALARGEMSQATGDHEIELVEVTTGSVDAGADGVDKGGRRCWLPAQLLDAATEYSVVAGNRSAAFTTLADEVALSRVWPNDVVTPQAVFCLQSTFSSEPLAHAAALAESASVSFGETGDGGVAFDRSWSQLAHQPPCWHWQGSQAAADNSEAASFRETNPTDTSEIGETRQPHLAGAALQPTWFARRLDEAPIAPQCAEGELTLGWGCAVVEDDRLLISGGESTSFWRVEGDASAWFVLEPGRTGVVKGLTPGQKHELMFTIHFAFSAPVVHVATVTMGSVRPHIVINEVMADPVGTEPDQEWVELFNDGTMAVNLEGWVLKDEGGEMRLPSVWLAPSGYALLVNDTYLSNAVGEPVPEANASIVRLPVLAKSGLSNSGEALRLLDKSDMVVASFPGTPKPTPGVSVARGAPWQLDESSAFGHHAPPGASPGTPNRLRAVTVGKQ
jgi:hypothetical protein